MVDSTVMYRADDYWEATRPIDPNARPAPLTAEQIRIRGLKQGGAFEELEKKLGAAGAA